MSGTKLDASGGSAPPPPFSLGDRGIAEGLAAARGISARAFVRPAAEPSSYAGEGEGRAESDEFVLWIARARRSLSS